MCKDLLVQDFHLLRFAFPDNSNLSIHYIEYLTVLHYSVPQPPKYNGCILDIFKV